MTEITAADITAIAESRIQPLQRLSIDRLGLTREPQEALMRAIIVRTLAGWSSERIQADIGAQINAQLDTGIEKMQRMLEP